MDHDPRAFFLRRHLTRRPIPRESRKEENTRA
jgi:hypothetical protein